MSTDNKTICHHLANISNRDPDRTAIFYHQGDHWKSLNWPEYFDKIQQTARALSQLGVQAGDSIAVMSNTRLEWSLADWAILGLNAITVPIYQNVSPQDLQWIIEDAKPKVLFVENRNVMNTFLTIRPLCPSVRKVVCFEKLESVSEDCMSFTEFLQLSENTASLDFKSSCLSSRLDAVATILYTSGTTGNPKGVVLTHQQIMSEVSEAFSFVGTTHEDSTLSFLPYAHIFGRVEHWGHVFTGFTMAYAQSIEKLPEDLKTIKPTLLISVPRIFEKVYSAIWTKLEANPTLAKAFRWGLDVGMQVGDLRMKGKAVPPLLWAQYQISRNLLTDQVKAAFGGRVRIAICGGAPLSREIALFFHACEILILEGYGLTETTAAIVANAPFDYVFGTVGKPIGEVQIKIADDGEILVKSKKVMVEYYHNPEATREAISDGWFRTGDIGEILPSGHLRITDRKKDLIKTAGGKYVAPQRLEGVLKKNPLISQVVIHGDQKPYVVALLTLTKGKLIQLAKEKNIEYQDIAELSKHPSVLAEVTSWVAEANSQLASYETIKRFDVLPYDFSVESGELTPSLKVRRKVCEQKFHKQIEDLYR